MAQLFARGGADGKLNNTDRGFTSADNAGKGLHARGSIPEFRADGTQNKSKARRCSHCLLLTSSLCACSFQPLTSVLSDNVMCGKSIQLHLTGLKKY